GAQAAGNGARARDRRAVKKVLHRSEAPSWPRARTQARSERDRRARQAPKGSPAPARMASCRPSPRQAVRWKDQPQEASRERWAAAKPANRSRAEARTRGRPGPAAAASGAPRRSAVEPNAAEAEGRTAGWGAAGRSAMEWIRAPPRVDRDAATTGADRWCPDPARRAARPKRR